MEVIMKHTEIILEALNDYKRWFEMDDMDKKDSDKQNKVEDIDKAILDMEKMHNDFNDLLKVCRDALADLEGIMPAHDPDGDRTHPAWETMKELKKIIKRTE
jgi:hypothetical protein